MGKVDIKKLKSQLTLPMYELILKEIGIPIFSKSDKEWRLWTGDKHKDPYTGSPKLYYYPDTGIFMSYTSARAMDIISLVQTRMDVLGTPVSFMDAVNLILSITGLDKDAVTRISKSKYQYDWQSDFDKFIRFKNGLSELKPYNDNILSGLSPSVPLQWIEEGISVETMQKYKIGYYERLNQTTIPVFDKIGNLCGVRIRNWRPDLIESAKYMPLITMDGTCYKFDTNKIFYGINYNWAEIERTGTAMIAESEKAVLKADTFWGDKSVTLAMFGGNLGTLRRNQLVKMGVKRVIYVPDCDYQDIEGDEFKEWEKKILNFVGLFKGFCQVEVVWDRDGVLGYKQNALDYDLDIWNKVYEDRQIFE